jgi:signal transduction histidine kinase
MLNILLPMQKCIFFLVSVLLFHSVLNAQPVKKFTAKSYDIKDGMFSKLVLDMVEDGNGFLWVSSSSGLQRFDGTSFQTISVQQGLPETKHISFFKLSNGNFWLRYEEGISIYNIASNKFHVVLSFLGNGADSLQKAYSVYNSVVPLMEIKDNIWCRDLQKKFILINKFSGKIVDSLLVPEKLQPTSYRSKKGNGNTLFFDAADNSIVQIDFSRKQIKHIYYPNPVSSIPTYTPINDTDIIITTDQAIYRGNMVTGATTFLTHYPASASKFMRNRTLTYLHNNLYVLTLNTDLFILNALDGKILYRMVDQQNKSFINQGYINKCITDRYNHLWVLSDGEGLSKINISPLEIKYYGVGELRTNYNCGIYPDKKSNQIITSTLFNGFFVYDTLQHLIKHLKLKFQEQAGNILKINPYKYLLFTNEDPGVYLFNAKNLQLTILDKKITKSLLPQDVSGIINVQQITDSTAVLFSNLSLYVINYSKENIEFTRIPIQKDFTCGFIDHKTQMWLGRTATYSFFTKKNLGKEKPFGEYENIFHLREKVMIKCFFEDKENKIWMGTEKGLYKLNGETGAIIHIYNKKNGLVNDTIYSITEDNNGNLWCGTNKGISEIDKTGKISNINASAGLQGNEFNTNCIGKSDDGELFFGGINGVNSFYPEIAKSLAQQPNMIMTNIKVMDADWQIDTAPWNIRDIKLPYTQNVVSFYFTALGSDSADGYNYEYKMRGVDKQWINSGSYGYARYILPPGKYIFEYTTGSEQSKNPLHKYIIVIVTPPFWQSWWFIILLAAVAVIILVAIVNFYKERTYKEKLRQMEILQTIQLERERISRDLHDNIGAYTTILIASAEQLKRNAIQPDIQRYAQNISENARNIVGALKETIWVLNKDVITISDFIDRYKSYAKKMLQNFPDTDVRFKEQFDKDFEFYPAEALTLFRIMQEAMQNAVKHSGASHIIISVASNKTISISIKDNGKGFNTNNITVGNGLHNMRHRAKEAGYDLKILSNEEGTEVTLQK